MSLYTALVEAGVEVSSWQSDLYFPINDTTRQILASFPKQKAIATTFTSNDTKKPTYEVPFAFDPYWENKFPKGVDQLHNADIINPETTR